MSFSAPDSARLPRFRNRNYAGKTSLVRKYGDIDMTVIAGSSDAQNGRQKTGLGVWKSEGKIETCARLVFDPRGRQQLQPLPAHGFWHLALVERAQQK